MKLSILKKTYFWFCLVCNVTWIPYDNYLINKHLSVNKHQTWNNQLFSLDFPDSQLHVPHKESPLSSAWDLLTQLCPGNSLQMTNWVNCRAPLICSPSIRIHCLLPADNPMSGHYYFTCCAYLKKNKNTYFRQENKSGPLWPWIKMSPRACARSQDPLCIWPHTTDSTWGLFLSPGWHLWAG